MCNTQVLRSIYRKNLKIQEKYDKAILDEFFEHYVETYYKIVSEAISQADPNHMFLTSRLHTPDKNREASFRIAGKYADIICYNYYKSWYPEQAVTEMWSRVMDKPFMITEWYAKGMDSGMENQCYQNEYFKGFQSTVCERCCGLAGCECDQPDDVFPHYLRDHDDCTPYVARNPVSQLMSSCHPQCTS